MINDAFIVSLIKNYPSYLHKQEICTSKKSLKIVYNLSRSTHYLSYEFEVLVGIKLDTERREWKMPKEKEKKKEYKVELNTQI